MVTLHLSAEDYARLAAAGVIEKDGVLQSSAGREVSAGTAVALLSKVAGEGYPDVAVTFREMPPPEAFDRRHLVAGHAAQSADDYTNGVPARGAAGVVAERERERAEHARPEAWAAAFKDRKKKPSRHKSRGRQAEQAAYDEGPRGRVETVKAVTPDPDEFQRGYLRAGHQAQSPAVTGVRGTVGLPPSNDGVAEPQHFDRGWLTQDHQTASPGDEGDNPPVQPGQPGWETYDAAAAAYGRNRSVVMTNHVDATGGISSEASPSPARWEPSASLGAANMPHPTDTAALPVGRAPGE